MSGARAATAEPPQAELDRLGALFNAGRIADGLAAGRLLVDAWPHSPGLHHALAMAHARTGDLAGANALLARAAALAPAEPGILNDHAAIAHAAGDAAGAMAAFEALVRLAPDHADALFNLAVLKHDAGDAAAAAALLRRVVGLRPQDGEALARLGLALAALGDHTAGEPVWRAALALRPGNGALTVNLALALRAQRRLDEAIGLIRGVLSPHFPEGYNALATLLLDRAQAGDTEEAAELLTRATALSPEFADAHSNLGNALGSLDRHEDAFAAYARALALDPDHAGALASIGATLANLKRHDEAIAYHARALPLMPDNHVLHAQALFARAHVCDWGCEADFAGMADRLGLSGMAVPPFGLLSLEDDPARMRRRTEAFARHLAQGVAPEPFAPPLPPATPAARLRIGYFSADFHDHATMVLLSGVLRHHDRSRFEVHAYAFGKRIDAGLAARLGQELDGFHDVRGLDDGAVAALARQHGIAVAIDLKGHTADGRPGIFLRRAAPLQVAWLGYPGPTGMDAIDYLVADPTLIPHDLRAHYGERLIVLPHSYQPNDDARAFAPDPAPRSAHGLPEAGMVFACFNAAWKIMPAEFAVWMRLLHAVDGSVLWLLGESAAAEGRLRAAARAQGVDPARLVFAPPVRIEAHLARHVHADLFLDTFRCNAHTTASDALWAGLPLLTLPGRCFQSRVAASLLAAAGLPDLIAGDVADYEAKALHLATDAAARASVRARLQAARGTAPLFDTARTTRALERGLALAWERHAAGLPPADIAVPDDPA